MLYNLIRLEAGREFPERIINITRNNSPPSQGKQGEFVCTWPYDVFL